MTKREFLRGLGVGAGALICRPVAARGDWPRILRDDQEWVEPGGRRASPEFQRFVTSVRVGDRATHGGLTVFWLHGAAGSAPPIAIATLEEARARGDLLISEREQAAVPTLVVDHRGPGHVLLLAGEILLGGKQNRVVREDALLPPRSGPITIAVYCVEQGRWVERSKRFDSRGAFAAPALRSGVIARAPQQRIWAEVDRYAARAEASSSTGSYQAVWDKPEVKTYQAGVEHGIGRHPAAGALGAAVFVGERLAGLDLFEDPGLFARQWPKLLGAYAVEMYDRRTEPAPEAPPLRARLADLLERAARVPGSPRRGAGVGVLFGFRVDQLHGAALLAEGRVVHAAIL